MSRTFVVELTLIIKRLCFYLTKHRAVVDAVLRAALSPGDFATVSAFLDDAAAVCTILRHFTGY